WPFCKAGPYGYSCYTDRSRAMARPSVHAMQGQGRSVEGDLELGILRHSREGDVLLVIDAGYELHVALIAQRDRGCADAAQGHLQLALFGAEGDAIEPKAHVADFVLAGQ